MNLEHLLRESIARFQALLHLQGEVSEALKKARPDEIEEFAEHMESLLRQARKVDLPLLPLLRREGEAVTSHPLFRERKELLGECARQMSLLLPKAEAGKAVAAADIAQIREGRTAMAGYGSGGRKRGNRVSGQV